VYLWEINARSDHVLILSKNDLYKPTNAEHLWYFSTLNYIPDIYQINWSGNYPAVPKIQVLDAGNNILEEHTADGECSWADITATYDDVSGYVTITRSSSIPIIVERYEDGAYNTFASFAADTTDIQVFLVAGKYRIRRDGADTECSETVELNLSKVAVKNSTEGEKLEIGRFGQLQVGKTPDDPDYDPAHDKTYIKFGIVDTPFLVSGSVGSTSLDIMVNPEKAPITAVKPMTYFKYSDTDYPNMVKIGSHIYFLRPSATYETKVEITPELKENASQTPVWLVNQFKIYSDLLVAKDKNRIIFEEAQLYMTTNLYNAVSLAKYSLPDQGIEYEFFAGDNYLRLRLLKNDGGQIHRIDLDIEPDGTAYIEITEPNGTSVRLQPISFNNAGVLDNYLNINKAIKIGSFTVYPNSAAPDGTLAVDASTGELKFRKNGTWYTVQLA